MFCSPLNLEPEAQILCSYIQEPRKADNSGGGRAGGGGRQLKKYKAVETTSFPTDREETKRIKDSSNSPEISNPSDINQKRKRKRRWLAEDKDYALLALC